MGDFPGTFAACTEKKMGKRILKPKCKDGSVLDLFEKSQTGTFLSRFNASILYHTNLTHSFPMHPFSTPWKHQKNIRFSDVFRE